MPEPNHTPIIQFRCPEDILEALEFVQAQSGQNRTTLINMALREKLFGTPSDPFSPREDKEASG